MAVNYNDGKWHGWDGGECPVHPKIRVEVLWRDGQGDCLAMDLMRRWGENSGELAIIAFRVIKEHKEPREWWAWKGVNGTCEFFDHKSDLDDHVRLFGRGVATFKVREVLDDES